MCYNINVRKIRDLKRNIFCDIIILYLNIEKIGVQKID